MKLTPRMQKVLEEAPETTKRETVLKMERLGLVEILNSWIVRGGMPGASAGGVKTGQWVTIFRVVSEVSDKDDQSQIIYRLGEMQYALDAGNSAGEDVPADVIGRWFHYVWTG